MNREILKTKSAKILLTFLAATFILSSISGVIFFKGKYDIIKLKGEEISIRDFYTTLNTRRQKDYMKNPSEKTIKYFTSPEYTLMVLKETSNTLMFNNEVGHFNISYSDKQLLDEIFNQAELKTNDKFDIKKYRELLSYNKLTERQYLNYLQNIHSKNFLLNSFFTNKLMPTKILNKITKIKNEVKVVDLYKVNKKTIKIKLEELKEDDLRKYYNSNIEKYTHQEEKKIDYVIINPNLDFEKNVSEEDLKKYYEENKNDFKIEKNFDIYEIKSKDKEAITKLFQELKNNKAITTLINKYLPDNKGEVEVKNLTESGFEYLYGAKIKTLKANKTTELQNNNGEYSFAFVKEIQEETFKSFEIAKEEIGIILSIDVNKDNVKARLEKIKQLILQEESLVDLSKIIKAEVNSLDYFTKETYKQQEFLQSLEDNLFNFKKNQFSELREINGVYYIFSVSDIKPYYVSTFEEVKKLIKEELTQDKKEKEYLNILSIAIKNNLNNITYKLEREIQIEETSKLYNIEFIDEIYTKNLDSFTNIYSLDKDTLYFAKIKSSKEIKEFEENYKSVYNLEEKIRNNINTEIEDLYLKYLTKKYKLKINENLLKYIQ